MKSILFASKPSNNNQLSVGSQLRRNDSSLNQHYHLNSNTQTKTDSVAESNDKEHFNKLFSNSKKQVIRNRCSAKSDVDKLKRTATNTLVDACVAKSDTSAEPHLIELQPAGELEFLENRPLIVDKKRIAIESETQGSGKSVKLINLRKKNGTTLVFQKKSNTQRQQKANDYQELESFKKRRSLPHWPNTGFADNSDTNSSSRHSWYDSDYYPRAIEEEFEESEVSLWWGLWRFVECQQWSFLTTINRCFSCPRDSSCVQVLSIWECPIIWFSRDHSEFYSIYIHCEMICKIRYKKFSSVVRLFAFDSLSSVPASLFWVFLLHSIYSARFSCVYTQFSCTFLLPRQKLQEGNADFLEKELNWLLKSKSVVWLRFNVPFRLLLADLCIIKKTRRLFSSLFRELFSLMLFVSFCSQHRWPN